jgi:predicted helicase
MLDIPALDQLLQLYRNAAVTEREKGTYFERLAAAYLTVDPIQAKEFSQVWAWADWAKEQGLSAKDTGIDLVAKLRNDVGFAAIQAKFYPADAIIKKQDIDSFISASGKDPFVRRLIIDTTTTAWSGNAELMIKGQTIPVTRIGLPDLRASPIDWAAFGVSSVPQLSPKKELRQHQLEALEAAREGLAQADRGKLIMACGTGKTFTSLRIAEDLAGPGKLVLFMVPSLALMAQTIREWVNDANVPIRAFSVCSDSQVGKRKGDDVAEMEIHDLALPATTDAAKLVAGVGKAKPDEMTVIFSTYQSIGAITDAQSKGLQEFDLVVCDEAHRTTGVTLADEGDSNFVRIHSDEYVRARKRLYMTATPRVFGDAARSKADDFGAELSSMDDATKFGETLFHRGFGWAVQNDLLTDYKVIVLAMDEALVSASVQKRLSDGASELVLDDATKIIGCYKALLKQDLQQDLGFDPSPMRRALAFCRSIDASKLVRDEFSAVVEEYNSSLEWPEEAYRPPDLEVDVRHVDGTFNARSRGELLEWLKQGGEANSCRVLTNARCLSEGVDVPSLDAIMFLHPRKSLIDVVQSVGRVMRKSPGKKMGYVILPVGIPAGKSAEEALKDNEKYRVVWQILNALRAHDDRFDSTINKASLGQDISDRIQIIGIDADAELAAITHTVNDLPSRQKTERMGLGDKAADEGDYVESTPLTSAQLQLGFELDEFTRAIMARIVKKCGTRDYWEDWATNIAEIAQAHITRIQSIIEQPGTDARSAFERFLSELRDDLNDTITERDAIEMLAQHLITRPVFETLFEGHKFTEENPVSRAIQEILGVLTETHIDRESRDLEKFYDSVRFRAQGLTDPTAKQKLVVELYDKFFRRAFPRTTEKLGIVYTPVEVVDFIIHSVNEALQSEFGQTLGSPGVHIMDPFTGTGTFITRLLQSGLIKREEMEHKFRHEIHANEIVLLAYYIAAINIEATYHGIMGGDYVPFEGMCLTDTFQLYEQDKDLISDLMQDNSARRTRQKELDIRVIVGNPPYSVGQKSENDNADNVSYPKLDGRIRQTYAAKSKATLARGLYDSYIRAIRWGSDRLGDAGVLAYVSNAGWLDANTADGLRKCLADEFSNIYVFHLRGNARTAGELRRREKDNVFGLGTRTPVAITLLIKNPKAAKHGQIHFHDIGDYLSREEKLSKISHFGSIGGITQANGWQSISPDDHGDWLSKRDGSFDKFIAVGDKKGAGAKIFENFSQGVLTARDAWTYNASKHALGASMGGMISFYNAELERFNSSVPESDRRERGAVVDSFINTDSSKISWSRALKADLAKAKSFDFDESAITASLYRPFTRQWLYYSRTFNEMVYQMPRIFPMGKVGVENRVIQFSGAAARDFSALMSSYLPSFDTIEKGQCLPRYVYEVAIGVHGNDEDQADLLADQNSSGELKRRDAISDEGLAYFQAAYPGEDISKDDLFHYVYGLLHSEDYRDRYADNLSKQLPRIPTVKSAADFWAFVEAGRVLGDMHADFDSVEPYPVTYKEGDPSTWVFDNAEKFYRVEKMRFGGKRGAIDKTTVAYNAHITMQNIPLGAYEYVVNGKPALEWVMERQVVKTDMASGIVNDANRYAIETVGDPAYPLTLFQRVITVSLETMKIVKNLPKLDI